MAFIWGGGVLSRLLMADQSLSQDWEVGLLWSQVTRTHAAAAGLDYNVRSVDAG